MFGVVLWSDRQEKQAVIWCEDHGDLAFYRNGDLCGDVTLDTGDWVQFDLTTDQQHRLAQNPRLIAEGLYPDIADKLGSALSGSAPTAPETARPQADILTFPSVERGATRPARADCA